MEVQSQIQNNRDCKSPQWLTEEIQQDFTAWSRRSSRLHSGTDAEMWKWVACCRGSNSYEDTAGWKPALHVSTIASQVWSCKTKFNSRHAGSSPLEQKLCNQSWIFQSCIRTFELMSNRLAGRKLINNMMSNLFFWVIYQTKTANICWFSLLLFVFIFLSFY